MVKRKGHFMEKLCTIDNINLADDNARMNKVKSKRYIKRHDRNREYENEKLRRQLESLEYMTSPYHDFQIFEPKQRTIYKLPYYPDRIAHHAIMNVAKEYWTARFIKTTYSCIEGRGIHACMIDVTTLLKKDAKGTKYCLKLDIRKFYPSIDHEILKLILARKIKDKGFLTILYEIIDSVDSIEELNKVGVPIGNYLSQYFANIYLTEFDWWCKQELGCKYYFRYADDIVVLSDDKDKLHKILICMKLYLGTKLKLKVKANYQVFPVESRGIDYVGYVMRHDYTLVRKSIKKRMYKAISLYYKNQITYEQLERRFASYSGWLKYCNSKHLLHIIYLKTGLNYSNFVGKKDKISNYRGRSVYLVHVDLKHRYYNLQFIYKGCPIQVRSKSQKLISLVGRDNPPQIIIL